MSAALEPLLLPMPDEPAVLVLAVRLEDATGAVLRRNFCRFGVGGAPPQAVGRAGGRRAGLLAIAPAGFHAASWSLKQWNVMEGLKVNGAGYGFFESRVAWPQGVRPAELESVVFLAEVSAKELFGKDREDAGRMAGDYMRGGGTYDPSRNPNAYPMTDGRRFPSAVTVRINDVVAEREMRSEERRVGKEGRSRWAAYH